MADLASSFTTFLFPEIFQPLDGFDEEIQVEIKTEHNDGTDNRAVEGDSNRSPCVSFKEPLKFEFDPKMDTSNTDTQEQENSPTTPSKPTEHHLPCLSPLTPTANLKILISAASPEIRVLASKRQKKALFDAIADHTSSLQEQELEGLQEIEIECSSQGEDGGEDGDKPINRKSKSLGLLCQRFLSKYPDYPENGLAMSISLDAVSKDLGVERRRIYDIVNVLESIEMVSRVAKNKYLWHGKINMDSTLARLKCLGEKRRYADQIEHLRRLQKQNGFYDEMETLSHQPFRDISNLSNHHQDVDDKKELDKFDEDTNHRRDKSLGIMSQKFIMLFLVSEAKVITLDIAARVLIGDINYEIREGSKFKTKVRRLYDIANILTSLNMIQKVHVHEGRSRKPAFCWTGPDPDISHLDPSNVSVENTAPSRQSFFSTPAGPMPTVSQQDPKPTQASHSKGSKKTPWSRHASFNAICEVVERERRSYSSAPSSPAKDCSQEEASPETQIDEKFQQDFEALRSKYPNQMSKIYVSLPEDQKENATLNNPQPSIAVSASTPKGTSLANAAHIAPLNPKVIVSPIPGSIPLTFNVIKSGGSFVMSSQDGSSNSADASVPSSSPNGVPNQQTDGKLEYWPTTKRRKLNQNTTASLRLSLPDSANAILQGQTQYLPINSRLVHPQTGKALQTVIIRREVSVLNKSPNGPLSTSTTEQIHDGKPQKNASRKTPKNHHKKPSITLSSTPESTANSIQTENSPELICTENLFDDVIVDQTVFNMDLDVNHCIQHSMELGDQKENTDKTGLKLDKSKNIKKTGIQGERKVTDVNTKRTPMQQQNPCRQKHSKRHRKRSVVRALHLCPEFRQGPIGNPDKTTGGPANSVPSNENLKPGGENGIRQVNKESVLAQCSVNDNSKFRSNGKNGSLDFGLDKIGKDFGDDNEDLAWPLHNTSEEPPRKTVFKKTVSNPKYVLAPWSGPPQASLASSLSLPCSPFSSLDLNAGSSLSPDYNRPRSVSGLGNCETGRWPLIRSPSIAGRDLVGSPVLFERFGVRSDTYKAPVPRRPLQPVQPSDLGLGWNILHQRRLHGTNMVHQMSPVPFCSGALEAPVLPHLRSASQDLNNMIRQGSPPIFGQYLYNGRLQHSPVVQESHFRPVSSTSRNLTLSFVSGQYLQNPNPQFWNPNVPSSQQASSKTCISPFPARPRSQSTLQPGTGVLPGTVITTVDQGSRVALQGRQTPHACQRSAKYNHNPYCDTTGLISGNGLVQPTVHDGINKY